MAELLRIAGLSDQQALELQEDLGSIDAKTVDDRPSDDRRHGDLGLSAVVVVLGAAGIHGIAVFLAKRRLKVRETDDVEISRAADGAVSIKIHHERVGVLAEPPDPSVIDSLKTDLIGAIEALPASAG